MGLLNLVTEPYDRQARLYPALLLIAPAVISVVAALSESLSLMQTLAALAAGCGLSFLLTQLARDAGKLGEAALFQQWGGMPSITIFRHRDMRIDAITKARYHETLGKLVKNAPPPSVNDEQNDPTKADAVYTAWSTALRGKTRNTKTYNLLFNENVSFGYRRNVFGMRKLGIIVSSTALAATAAWSCYLYNKFAAVGAPVVGALVFDLTILILWVYRISASWVRIPADAYAERLAEATDTITGEKEPKQPARQPRSRG